MAKLLSGTRVYGNLTIDTFATATGNVTGGNLITAGLLSVTGNANVGNLGTAGVIVATGNITGGNLTTAGRVDATGNVSGGNLTTAGAVTGNGRALTSLDASNLDTGTVPSGRLTGSYSISVTSATTAGTVTTAAQPNITSVGTLSSLTVTGNVAGGNLTTGAQVVATGNVTGGNLVTAGRVVATGNVTGGNLTTAGRVDATGNITGGNLSGTLITGTLTTAAQPNVTSIGTLSSLTVVGPTTHTGNIDVTGNINVTGNLNYSNVTDLVVGDPLIFIGANNTGNLVDLGEVVQWNDGTAQYGGLVRDASDGVWKLFGNVTSAPTTTVNFTNALYQSLLVGPLTASSGSFSTTLGVTGNANVGNLGTAGVVVATGNITGGNLTTAGLVSATGNITGGNLTTAGGVDATGNITGANIVTTGNVSANNVILVGTEASSALQNNNDITGWYWTGNSFSVTSQESAPTGIFFKPDGTKMYIIGFAGDDINEYDLSTAWDITTATAVGVSAALGESTPQDLYITADGTACYVIGSSGIAVRQFTFGTAWQANTLSFVRSFSVSGQETSPTGITFKPDLTQMFICGTSGDGVDVYNLSSAGNIATATFSTFVSLSAQDTAPQAIQFNSDGTRFYMLGSTGDDINRYDLSTPYDLTTATFFNNSFYWGFIETSPNGMFLEFSQNRAWIVGSSSDSVREIETRGDGLRATGDSNYFDGFVYVGRDLDVRGNAVVETAFNVLGTTSLSTTTVSGTLTASSTLSAASTVTMSTTTGTISIGTSQTTGTTIVGGTSQTGAINIGRSTANQSIVIGNGVTGSGNVKTIDIGTLGASGSNTNVTIGSATAGAQTNITLYGNTAAGNLTTTGVIEATGNLSGGNISTAGNVSGNYILGNGSQLTGLPATYGNVDVADFLANGFGSNSITTTGNISGGNILGNGATLSGINAFGNIAVAGETTVSADTTSDTLTFAEGTGISIVTDAANNTITIGSVATDSIFATGGDMGLITEAVTVSEDLGLITDVATIEYDLGLIVTAGVIQPDSLILPTKTVAQLANLSASPAAQFVYCSDESGGAVPAFSDGTNWRRVTDRAVVT